MMADWVMIMIHDFGNWIGEPMGSPEDDLPDEMAIIRFPAGLLRCPGHQGP